MKTMLLTLILGLTSSAFAANQIPVMSLDTSRGDGKTLGTVYCTESIPLPSSAKSVFDSVMMGLYPRGQGEQQIQENEAASSAREANYTGDYIKRVFLVNRGSQQAYPFGVWESVTITYYKKSQAVEVEVLQLNYLDSKELTEGRCDHPSYLLKPLEPAKETAK